MPTMFLGKSQVTLDPKRRFQFPSKLRELLDAVCAKQVVVVSDARGFLEIYPSTIWEKRAELIDALPQAAAQEKVDFYSNSEHAEIDSSGRLSLTATQCEEAGFNAGTLLLKSAGTHFELWNVEREAAQRAAKALQPQSAAYLAMPAAASVKDLMPRPSEGTSDSALDRTPQA